MKSTFTVYHTEIIYSVGEVHRGITVPLNGDPEWFIGGFIIFL